MARRNIYGDRLQPGEVVVGSIVGAEEDARGPGMRREREGRPAMAGAVELDDLRLQRAGAILYRHLDRLIGLEVLDRGCVERDGQTKLAVLFAATCHCARHG